jgi:hypothetical protein
MVMIVERLLELMSGEGNRSPRRKLAPVPPCPPQSPHDLTRAATVQSQHTELLEQMESSCECCNEPSHSKKMLENYCVATQLVTCPVVLSFLELVQFSYQF